jgi:hypothetical protein
MKRKHEGPTDALTDPELFEGDIQFLKRFVGRGWLAAPRDNPNENGACLRGVKAGYLKRARTEYQFTEAGRIALTGA